MPDYLGETVVASEETPYKDFAGSQWAMLFIQKYGQFAEPHHKTWVLDQVARILLGSGVYVKLAKWSDGQYEYRISTGVPSERYLKWVETMKEGGYTYDEGICP